MVKAGIAMETWRERYGPGAGNLTMALAVTHIEFCLKEVAHFVTLTKSHDL
jgi:hypothetical protein